MERGFTLEYQMGWVGLERWYAPDIPVTEQSSNYPEFLKWLGWLLASLGAIAYIVIDCFGKM